MARKPVLDRYRNPIGWIEDIDGLGRIRVLNANLSVTGYVDIRRNVTVDAQYRIVSQGQMPGLLLR